MCPDLHQNQGRCWRCEFGLSPPVEYSKAVLLLWIFFFCLVFDMLCAGLFICALWSPGGKELASWISFVVYNCEFVTVPLVS